MERQFVERAITKMMQTAGYDLTYDDMVEIAKEDEVWYQTHTMTSEQEDQFRNWFLTEANEELGWNQKLAGRKFDWFNLAYGLKIEEDE